MDATRDVVYTVHEARKGVAWLKDAWALFSRARMPWLFLLATYYVVMMAVDLVPFVGQLAVPLIKPVFAVGFLAAAWTQERGGTPALGQLLQGFRANLLALLAIGVFFVVGITVAVFASSLVDGGQLVELMGGGGAMTEAEVTAALADGRLQLGMAFSALLSLPIVIATWWAPALVVFQDAGAAAALAASLRAALANWKPLAVYGLGVFFYGGVVPGLIIAVIAMVLPSDAGRLFVIALLLPYSLFFAATLHVSDYVSYREVFHSGETLAPLSRGS